MIVRKYPIGIQSFQKMREDGYLYVDKTSQAYDLTQRFRYVFLSRPRRFGKSLLSSTLKCYFEGRKELFKGLAIEKLETNWEKHPVLYFDFSTAKVNCIEDLHITMNNDIHKYEEIYGLSGANRLLGDRLLNLIEAAHQQSGLNVVVIIDEYDAPLLNVAHNQELMSEIRDVMQNFYSPLKRCDQYLHFVFLTGVTKFSQLSIFSGLNNIMNVSMMPEYSGICGITNEELECELTTDVEELAEANKVTVTEMKESLRKNYDGYHFSEDSDDIFNPFSLLKAFATKKIKSYWFDSGTPTFLIHLMESQDKSIEDFQGIYAEETDFDAPIDNQYSIIPLLYHSGYLTIKSYDGFGYTLGIPNEEVLLGLSKVLLPRYTRKESSETNFMVRQLRDALVNDDVEGMLLRLQSFYSSIPNDLENKTEKHYQTIFYTIFSLLGAMIQTEVKTATGRADAVVKTASHIYVIEMKFGKSAEAAMKQIEQTDYLAPYAFDGRKVVKVAVNFDSAKRTLGSWIIEE